MVDDVEASSLTVSSCKITLSRRAPDASKHSELYMAACSIAGRERAITIVVVIESFEKKSGVRLFRQCSVWFVDAESIPPLREAGIHASTKVPEAPNRHRHFGERLYLKIFMGRIEIALYAFSESYKNEIDSMRIVLAFYSNVQAFIM
jgi:hypothetical protein